MQQTIVMAQGGGPTAVINQTLVGAVLEARKAGMSVLGGLHGVRGIRDNRFVDLTHIPEAQLMAVAGTPSAALGSIRDKPDQAYCELILAGLKKVGAECFHLYRRQRYRGNASDPLRRRRRHDGLRACAQDHRQ